MIDPLGGNTGPVELAPGADEVLAQEPFRSAVERTLRASIVVNGSTCRVRAALSRGTFRHRPTQHAMALTYGLFLSTRRSLERSAATIVNAANLAAKYNATPPDRWKET